MHLPSDTPGTLEHQESFILCSRCACNAQADNMLLPLPWYT